jgi:hypothetical protein
MLAAAVSSHQQGGNLIHTTTYKFVTSHVASFFDCSNSHELQDFLEKFEAYA